MKKRVIKKAYDKEAKNGTYDKIRYSGTGGKLYLKIQKDIIYRLLNINQFDQILELGVGTGIYSRDIIKLNTNLISLDFSFEMLRHIKRNQDVIPNLICADIEKLPFKENIFEKILCIRTITFIPNIAEGLSEIHRIMKINCYFIFNFHNNTSISNKVSKLIGYDAFTDKLNKDLTHSYSFNKLIKLLHSKSFKIVDKVGTIWLTEYFYKIVNKFQILTLIGEILESLISFILPPRLAQMVFLKIRKISKNGI